MTAYRLVEDFVVDTFYLADILQLHHSMLYKLARPGGPLSHAKVARNAWDLRIAVRRYVAWLSHQHPPGCNMSYPRRRGENSQNTC